jgi:hypothetical protein
MRIGSNFGPGPASRPCARPVSRRRDAGSSTTWPVNCARWRPTLRRQVAGRGMQITTRPAPIELTLERPDVCWPGVDSWVSRCDGTHVKGPTARRLSRLEHQRDSRRDSVRAGAEGGEEKKIIDHLSSSSSSGRAAVPLSRHRHSFVRPRSTAPSPVVLLSVLVGRPRSWDTRDRGTAQGKHVKPRAFLGPTFCPTARRARGRRLQRAGLAAVLRRLRSLPVVPGARPGAPPPSWNAWLGPQRAPSGRPRARPTPSAAAGRRRPPPRRRRAGGPAPARCL